MIIRIIFVFSLLMILTSCDHDSVSEDQVVARVGSEVLSIDDVERNLPETMKDRISLDQIKGFVEHWVNTQLVYQQAYRSGLHNTISDELQRELKKFEVEFLANKLVEREINRKIQVNEEEINEYYEQNKEQFTRVADEVQALHLVTSSRENSSQISRAVRGGTQFEELIKQFGEPNSLWPNGDLGYFPLHVLPDDIRRGISRLKKGETSRPIQTEFGYHFFHIIDLQQKGNIKDLEEVRDQIAEKLKIDKHNEAYRAYLAKLRNRADEQKLLKINYKTLKTFQNDSTNTLLQ